MPLTDKCIILDLDETLVHSIVLDSTKPEDINYVASLRSIKSYRLKSKIYDFDITGCDAIGSPEKSEVVGTIRPGLDDFLKFCFDYFSVVAIWSAGVKEYVVPTTNYIFRNIGSPHVIYAYTDCIDPHTPKQRKPIEKMAMIPELNGLMNLRNTILLDNDRNNGLTEPHNTIVIPDYAPEPTDIGLLKFDDSLGRITNWFLSPEVMKTNDIREIRKDIF